MYTTTNKRLPVMARKKSPQASKYLLSQVDTLQYSELQAENNRCGIKASGQASVLLRSRLTFGREVLLQVQTPSAMASATSRQTVTRVQKWPREQQMPRQHSCQQYPLLLLLQQQALATLGDLVTYVAHIARVR